MVCIHIGYGQKQVEKVCKNISKNGECGLEGAINEGYCHFGCYIMTVIMANDKISNNVGRMLL